MSLVNAWWLMAPGGLLLLSLLVGARWLYVLDSRQRDLAQRITYLEAKAGIERTPDK